MTRERRRYVVDATLGVKLVRPEEFSERAQAVFDQIQADPPARLYVPDLFYVECTNTLWKHVRQFGYPRADARRDVRNLRSLALRVVSTADLMEPALDIASNWEVSAYDACYVALSDLTSSPLVTADKRLVRKLAGSRHDVRWLGDCEIPGA